MSRPFHFLIPLTLLVTAPVHAGPEDHWIILPRVTTQNLNRMSFLDSLRGWVVGNGGTILRTTNGGATWVYQNAGIENNLHEVFMLDNERGWALGYQEYTDTNSWYGTYILKTTNGGGQWSAARYPTHDAFHAIVFLDNLTGWMGGEYGVLVGTTDGGGSWFPADVDSSAFFRWAIRKLKFFSRQYGVGLGGQMDLSGTIWQTTNGGQHWTAVEGGLEPLHGIHRVDSMRLITVGGDFDYGAGTVETTDAGVTWEYRYLGIWGEARALSFRTAYEGWAPLGFAGTYMFTTDTGRTWTDAFTPDTSGLYDLVFIDSLSGYAVGQRGTILKYDPNIVAVRSAPPHIAPTAELRQNHPNPFNPISHFGFRISDVGLVSLKVYDLLGRQVAVLANEEMHPGNHEVPWDAPGVASGVYFYRLEFTPANGATGFVDVKKMVVIR